MGSGPARGQKKPLTEVVCLDYDKLLNFATEVGYQLQMCGAEIYRVEDSVRYILSAYGISTGEVFAIPNCLNVSLATPDGRCLTRIRRVGIHGTDIYRLEALNTLSRSVAAGDLTFEEAQTALGEICRDHRSYSRPVQLAAYAVGSAAFVLFWGGDLRDALCGAACGIAIGLSLDFMSRLRTNLFFKTFVSACLSALIALLLVAGGVGSKLDTVIIGALMALVPGLSFTNAMRDIIAGDMVTGITKTTESILLGVAIALGTAIALYGAPLLGVIA